VGLPENGISFIYIEPLAPTYKAGLTGHLPVKCQMNQKANPKAKTEDVILEFVLIFDPFGIWTFSFV
jgi:hypothetical protein